MPVCWVTPSGSGYPARSGTTNSCGNCSGAEPGLRRVRDAASLLGDDVWICVTVPGGLEGAEGDPAPGEDVIRQWTSVVTDAGELRWLKEMLALNAAGDEAGG